MIRLGSKRKERVIYNPEPHHHYTLVQLLRENSLEKNGSFLYVDLKKNNWIMSYLIKGCPPNKMWQMCLHFRPLQEIYFLAVQDSSIGDIVSQSVSQSVIF